jgi:xanthine dehydrogenase iron-sulfur cluster and FAD-binding subunit A
MIEWTSASRGDHTFDVLASLQYANATDEFVRRVHIPFSRAGQLFDSYKIAARHQNAHAIVNGAFNLAVDAATNRVTGGA